MSDDLKLFKYAFVDNQASRTLFLLHGTGGNKEDFLFLNEQLNKKYNLVSLEGNINENGNLRFFRRHSFDVFDQKNIREESDKLQKFISTWIKEHNILIKELYFLGYSNGANMLLAVLFYRPDVLKNLILLHPMLPFTVSDNPPDLSGHKILVSIGLHDHLVSPAGRSEVARVLKSWQAQLTVKTYNAGHEITPDELQDLSDYLSY